MDQGTMSTVLSYYRKKYGIRQEDICNGICSVTTYYRLEQGLREIDSLMGEMLLGRIGKEVTLFETMLNDEDYELWRIREEIEQAVEQRNHAEAEKKLAEYRGKMPAEEQIHEQYCLYQESRILIAQGETGQKLCGILERAIRITIPDFADGSSQRFYNPMEAEMILSLLRYGSFDADFSGRILLQLLFHVKQYYFDRKRNEIGTDIYLALIETKRNIDDKEKVLLYAEQAIAFINEGNGYHHLGDLYFIKAQMTEKLYHSTDEWEKYRDVCRQDCMIAYHLYEMEENSACETVRDFFPVLM